MKLFPAIFAVVTLLPAVALAHTKDIDSGNTAWVLVCSALVMLMTPGLAFFYAGMVSRKNVVSTLLQNFVVLALIGLIWISIGYSLVFTDGNSFIGGFDALFLNNLESNVYGDSGVPMLAFAAFQMMFAIITPAIITGAIAERVHFKAWLMIMTLWSVFVYLPVAHWVWGPNGWLATIGGLDFAGGLVVHITAGFSGLVAAYMFGRRINQVTQPPNDIPMIILGAALLWFGWFGFNAGSAITSGVLASYAFMNTFVAAAAALLMWLFIDWLIDGKPTAFGSAVAVIAGLVSITPAAGFVTISSSLVIAAVVALCCNMSVRFLKKRTVLDDSLDVFACHGIGGVVGSILTGFFATQEVNPIIAEEGMVISGEFDLLIANTLSVFAVALFSLLMTFIIIKIVGMVTPIRVAEEEETRGLDQALHGEMARFRGQ